MSTPKPFRFYSRLTIRESTGSKATSLLQLLKLLQSVPGSVIYYHTHHYLQQHQQFSPEPPNDFAYWVTEVLGEKTLGEALSSIDTIQFRSIHDLREKIVQMIQDHLTKDPALKRRVVNPDEAFYFIKAVSVVFPTPLEAKNLEEFVECLKAVTIDSIYFHVFEAPLRLKQGVNDFSLWFEDLGESTLSRALATLDPYTYTMEELRQTILRLVQKRLPAKVGNQWH